MAPLLGRDVVGALKYTGNGNPRGIYDPQYNNVAPRIAATWAPVSKLVMRAGFGMFYTPAIEFGDYQGLSLNGFTQATPFVGSVDGITPANLLSNPFPNGLLLPPGKAAGDRTNLGLSINATERDRPTPYVEQWMFGVQYEALSNTVLEAAYIGNHGLKLPFNSLQRDQLLPQYLSLGDRLLDPVPNPFLGIITAGSLSGPTVPRGQLLRPYPQYNGVSAVQPPAGFSSYNAFSVSANRRFSQGLQFLVSFTASKYLTNNEGQEGWTNGAAQNVRNYYDTALEKSLMIDDIPRSLVASYIYELPVGEGKAIAPANKVVDAVVSGWQVRRSYHIQVRISAFDRRGEQQYQLFRWQSAAQSRGRPALSNPSIDNGLIQCICAAARIHLRERAADDAEPSRARDQQFRRHNSKILETVARAGRLQFRTEFFNLFNRTSYYAPNTSFGNPNFGKITGALPARSIQFGMKIYW